MHAIQHKHVHAAQMLIDHGAITSHVLIERGTIRAFENSDYGNESDPDLPWKDRQEPIYPSPLTLAIRLNCSNSVAMLLSANSTIVDEKIPDSYETNAEYPLHRAVRYENLTILQMLMKKARAIDCVDDE